MSRIESKPTFCYIYHNLCYSIGNKNVKRLIQLKIYTLEFNLIIFVCKSVPKYVYILPNLIVYDPIIDACPLPKMLNYTFRARLGAKPAQSRVLRDTDAATCGPTSPPGDV